MPKSEFIAEGYQWVCIELNTALLRAADGRVELWRVARDGDTSDHGKMLKSSKRGYIRVKDVTFMPLPEWGRLDLPVGQYVELEAINPRWLRGDGYGFIERLFTFNGGARYKVRMVASGDLSTLRPRQIRPFPSGA